MAIVINGSGTVTGIAVGGLPDGTVDAGTLATNSVDSAELVDGSIDSSHLASGVGGVAGISSSDAGTTVITNKALGKAALTLKSLQGHAAGVGTEIVALNFAAHNYYSASNPGIYGQISCENGNGNYSDRGQLVFSTGYGGNQITERLVITSTGVIRAVAENFNAGMSTSNYGWEINQNGDSPYIHHATNGTGNTTLQVFINDNGTVGTIKTNGSATSFNTSSDYRLKENVDYTWDATTRLKQLKPARFNFIADDTNTLVDGFIAHEVSSVVPEAISGAKDAMTAEVLYVEGDDIPEGKSVGDVKTAAAIDPQGIDQSKLVPLLVKTIQELEARITALEA